MILAAQACAALALLGWTVRTLAPRSALSFDEVCKALDDIKVKDLTGLQLSAIRGVLGDAGIEFVRRAPAHI